MQTDEAKKSMTLDLSSDMEVAEEPSSPVVKKKIAPKPGMSIEI